MQLTVSKDDEILPLTTFVLLYNTLRQPGTGASSWNTGLKLTWLRHQKFQNSFTCAKLLRVYRQHFIWQAWQSWLYLALHWLLPVTLSFCYPLWVMYAIVQNQRATKMAYKISEACNLLVSKVACTILLKEKALTIQCFSLCMGKSHHGFYPNRVRHRSYWHYSTINFLLMFH